MINYTILLLQDSHTEEKYLPLLPHSLPDEAHIISGRLHPPVSNYQSPQKLSPEKIKQLINVILTMFKTTPVILPFVQKF